MPSSSSGAERKNIAIVGLDPHNIKFLSTIFEESGYTPLSRCTFDLLADEQDIKKIIEPDSPPVLICEVSSPVRPCLDFLDHMKSLTSIIIVTTNLDEVEKELGPDTSCISFSWPIENVSLLVESVARYFEPKENEPHCVRGEKGY